FSSNTPMVSTVGNDGITPKDPLRNPFPDGFNLPKGASEGLLSQVGQSLSGGWPSTLLPTYNQQWNFTIQRSVGRDMLWEIAYAGNKGSKVAVGTATWQMNQIHPNYLSLGDQLLELVPNPFAGLITVGALARPMVQRGQLLRPFPLFTGVTPTNAAWGNTNYHALQT